MTKETIDLIIEWFAHIEQLATDRKTQTGIVMDKQHCFDEISAMASRCRQFVEKYKDDGIIWYFDNCELSSEDIIRTMWKFKQLGYFENASGIIFGRTMLEVSNMDISFKDAVKHSLSELNIPIILDADIGHKPPQFTIINGALAKVKYANHFGQISFRLT